MFSLKDAKGQSGICRRPALAFKIRAFKTSKNSYPILACLFRSSTKNVTKRFSLYKHHLCRLLQVLIIFLSSIHLPILLPTLPTLRACVLHGIEIVYLFGGPATSLVGSSSSSSREVSTRIDRCYSAATTSITTYIL